MMRKVQVLLSTYNGERFLDEQLKSLTAQKGIIFDVLVRDDGSSDSTTKILDEWQNKGLLHWYHGNNIGPAKSFLDLMKNAPETDYYAFCDQDDVWLEHKLQKAAERLDNFDTSVPALYFSKTQFVDVNLNPIGKNNYPDYVFSFGQALIRNNAVGCTMVFNRRLLNIINDYEPAIVQMHDYWLYLVCLAVAGNVVCDPVPYIKYRQHGKSAVGSVISGTGSVRRQWKLLFHSTQPRLKTAIELLEGYKTIMPARNKEILNRIINYKQSFPAKFMMATDKDIRDMSLKYNILKAVAVMLERF